jgi:hypothetical protein
MTWNYRVVRHIAENAEWYGIHEVYYEDENVVTMTEDMICPSAGTAEGLKADFKLMMEAFEKPVLEYIAG